MYLISLLNGFILLSAVTIPFFKEWGGLNFTQILFLQSWFMTWGFILEVPTGTIADIIGRKQSIITGLITSGTGLLIYGIKPDFQLFMLAEFIIALGNAFISGADKALVYDTLEAINEGENATKIFGRMKSMKTIGAIIGPIIGSIIAKTIGLNYPIMIEGVATISAGLIAITLKEPIKMKSTIKDYWQITKKGIKTIIKNQTIRILTIDFITIAIIFRFFMWLWQPVINKAGIDIIYYGLIASTFNTASLILLSRTQTIEKKIGMKKTVTLIGLISGASIIMMSLTSNWLITIMLITITFSLLSIRGPIYLHYLNYHIKTEIRATTLSSIAMIRKLLTAITYPLIGLLMDWNLNNTLIIIGATMIILTIITIANKQKYLRNE